MKRADLLVEIGTEEIPARFLPPARAALASMATNALSGWGLHTKSLTVVGTPRRITLIARGLETAQPDRQEVVIGPPWERAFVDGKPSPAAIGFAAKHGVTPESLERIENARGVFTGVHITRAGRATAELLTEMLPQWLGAIPFGKNMRWEPGGVRFARPIRWLLAVFGGSVLPLEFAGLKAGDTTRGHRFLGKAEIKAPTVARYLRALARNGVVVDPIERRRLIRERGDAAAAAAGLTVEWDEHLLDEVADLVEWPQPMLGTFAAEFLDVYEPLLIAPMRGHQKYFPLRRADGTLANRFLFVANRPDDPKGHIVSGNERVLGARLSDAKFFWDHDRSIKPDDLVKALARITWQDGLGTLDDLRHRVKHLASKLADQLEATDAEKHAARRAAELYLCDLGSLTVYEFAELQGEMAAKFAEIHGEPAQVVQAIRDAHRPKSAEDALPETKAGAIVALAARIDLIVGNLIAGHEVRGNQDPYGMRRAANGVFRILLSQGIDADPSQWCTEHWRQFARLHPTLEAAQALPKVDPSDGLLQFWSARLGAYLLAVGLDADVVRTAMTQASRDGRHATLLTPSLVERRATTLMAYMSDPVRRDRLLDTYKRLRNIARDATPLAPQELEGWADGTSAEFAQRLAEFFSKDLLDAAAAAACRDEAAAIEIHARLIPVIEKLFMEVRVNDADAAVAQLRKRLVATFKRAFDLYAVFDHLVGGGA